jgi:hypothetical protein
MLSLAVRSDMPMDPIARLDYLPALATTKFGKDCH